MKDEPMTPQIKELLRALPSVSTLLEHEEVVEWLHGVSRATVVASLQAAVDSSRQAAQIRLGCFDRGLGLCHLGLEAVRPQQGQHFTGPYRVTHLDVDRPYFAR